MGFDVPMLYTSMNLDEFLAEAFTVPYPSEPIDLPEGSRCSRDGKLITKGYRFRDVVAKTTPVVQEIFRVRSPYVSVASGRLMSSGKVGMGGIFGQVLGIHHSDGTWEGMFPTISRKTAEEKGKKCWHDLLSSLPIGVECVAIFSDDSKKRLWVDAEVSRFGPCWRPYYHSGNDSRLLTINVERLREILLLVETLYSIGCPKQALRTTLCDQSASKVLQQVGVAQILKWERQIAPWRDTDELLLATYVVQANSTITIEPFICQKPLRQPDVRVAKTPKAATKAKPTAKQKKSLDNQFLKDGQPEDALTLW